MEIADRIIAVIALCALVAFCSVLLYFVQRLDLTIVVVVCVLMGAYDLITTAFGWKVDREDGRKL